MIEIGRHRLLQGDITQGAVGVLMGEERADVIYSDPPWGPGNQKYWHTMNGTTPQTPWRDFLHAFCTACATYRKPHAPVFVEMGLRWVTDLDDEMAAVGLSPLHHWDTLYGPKSKPLPNQLTLYSDGGGGCGMVSLDIPLYGEPMTWAVLSSVVGSGDVVLDPCTGLGMTARHTHKLGASFRGTELNPIRLKRTVDWLEKHR